MAGSHFYPVHMPALFLAWYNHSEFRDELGLVFQPKVLAANWRLIPNSLAACAQDGGDSQNNHVVMLGLWHWPY